MVENDGQQVDRMVEKLMDWMMYRMMDMVVYIINDIGSLIVV